MKGTLATIAGRQGREPKNVGGLWKMGMGLGWYRARKWGP